MKTNQKEQKFINQFSRLPCLSFNYDNEFYKSMKKSGVFSMTLDEIYDDIQQMQAANSTPVNVYGTEEAITNLIRKDFKGFNSDNQKLSASHYRGVMLNVIDSHDLLEESDNIVYLATEDAYKAFSELTVPQSFFYTEDQFKVCPL